MIKGGVARTPRHAAHFGLSAPDVCDVHGVKKFPYMRSPENFGRMD